MGRLNACEFYPPPCDAVSRCTYSQRKYPAQSSPRYVHQKVSFCHSPAIRLSSTLLLFLRGERLKTAERWPDSQGYWPPCRDEFQKFAPSLLAKAIPRVRE